MTTLGEKLAILLKENDMTQKELAERVETTEMTISRYVRDERQPKAEILSKIASALKTTTDDLLSRDSVENDEAEFQKIHRLIARNASKMSIEKKQKLISTLLKDDE